MRLEGASADIDDVDRFVERLDDIGDRHGCAIQAFDARYVACPRQVRRAVELADRAFERGENVARDRSVEILLYAAGRRQIDRALEMGVKPGVGSVVFVVDAEDGDGVDTGDGGDRDARGDERERAAVEELCRMVDIDPEPTMDRVDVERISAFFGITEAERSATDADLCALVCERVALLDVEK